MWEKFGVYEGVIDRVSRKWFKKLGGRFDLDELKNELVLLYAELYPVYNHLPQVEFSKILWVSSVHRIIDLIRREKIYISIDDVNVVVESKDFCKEYFNIWLEYVQRFLSVDGRELIRVILGESDELEKFHFSRTEGNRYYTRLSQEDVRQFFVCKKGWAWSRIDSAIKEVKEVLNAGV